VLEQLGLVHVELLAIHQQRTTLASGTGTIVWPVSAKP
jgi:hypothetical protein